MQTLRILLVSLASLVLGAHLLRQGWLAAAVVTAALPLLLAVRRRWALRAVQLVLAVGAVEWLRTLLLLVDVRRSQGVPALRLTVILAAVTLLTATAVPLAAGFWSRRRAAGLAVAS